MKLTRNHLTFGLLAIVAVMALFAVAGHPLINPEALAGLGMIPFAMSGEIELKDIKSLVEKKNEAWGEFTRKNDELLKAKAEGSEFEFDNDAWQFGVDAWRGVGYGYWQHAVLATMT